MDFFRPPSEEEQLVEVYQCLTMPDGTRYHIADSVVIVDGS